VITDKLIERAFRGKTFVLTGAAGGLGGSMARILAPYWDSALLLDVNAAGLEAVARDVDPSGTKVVTRSVDLSSEESIAQAVADLPPRLDPPDVLVNNAGISFMGMAGAQPLGEYRKMMDVNYLAVVALINRFLPAMLGRRSGTLLTIASGSGVLANYGGTGYCASKFAVVGYMEALRQELAGTGVKTHCVLLPTVMTDFHRKLLEGEFQDMAKSLPTITPDEAAHKLLLQAALGREIVSFGPTVEAGMLINRLAPGALRAAMSLNGYMLNRKRGRV
jgi:NAD(P)-dependent dehydrogenase (short-subunit alcohol dehydrogenase family)